MAQVVNLATSGTNYDLATLLVAVSSKERIHGASITIQALPANSADVLLGGADIAAASYGVRLAPGDVYTIDGGGGANTAHLNAITARPEGNDQKLAITVNVS